MFDKNTLLDAVKKDLSVIDRQKTSTIDLSMVQALDDLSLRLKSKSFLSYYDTTVAVNTREIKVTGENNDLQWIYALKLTYDSQEAFPDWYAPDFFLRQYDSATASASLPTKYTVIYAGDGFPIIRFNCPLAGSTTMRVYYYTMITDSNIQAAKSLAAMVAGTLAYFYGTKSKTGILYYEEFKNMAALMRAVDNPVSGVTHEMRMSQQDRSMMGVKKGLMRKRE